MCGSFRATCCDGIGYEGLDSTFLIGGDARPKDIDVRDAIVNSDARTLIVTVRRLSWRRICSVVSVAVIVRRRIVLPREEICVEPNRA